MANQTPIARTNFYLCTSSNTGLRYPTVGAEPETPFLPVPSFNTETYLNFIWIYLGLTRSTRQVHLDSILAGTSTYKQLFSRTPLELFF